MSEAGTKYGWRREKTAPQRKTSRRKPASRALNGYQYMMSEWRIGGRG
jgi:hypothetical protein